MLVWVLEYPFFLVLDLGLGLGVGLVDDISVTIDLQGCIAMRNDNFSYDQSISGLPLERGKKILYSCPCAKEAKVRRKDE